jgi:hypothetical protein
LVGVDVTGSGEGVAVTDPSAAGPAA